MAKLTGNAWNAHEDETKDFHSGDDCNKWVDYAINEMGCAGMSLSLFDLRRNRGASKQRSRLSERRVRGTRPLQQSQQPPPNDQSTDCLCTF
jgi:hypothetical protein